MKISKTWLVIYRPAYCIGNNFLLYLAMAG